MLSFKDRWTIRQHANDLMKNRCYEECIDWYERACKKYPFYPWYPLYIGDIYRYYLGDKEKALLWHELLLQDPKNMADTSPLSPTRYLLKRVANAYYQQENWAKAVYYFKWFISFQPSNFHDKEFVRYAVALEHKEKKEEALQVLSLGMRYSHSRLIREYWNTVSPEKVEIIPFPKEKDGFERIPIETSIIMPGDDLPRLIDQYTQKIRKPGDIITVASCVVAVAERRMYSIDDIQASPLAILLAKCVHDDQFPFGGNAPLCNPLSMQAAIKEVGWARILFSAILGGLISKLIRGSGMFYRMAGEQAALIDDMPGAIPPFDYYVVMGPRNSMATCKEIKKLTGHESAVVDANDLQVAWAVGCSNSQLRTKVESALRDNPAGNGDQKTPIILLRPLK